ncbi:MAG: MFS transporter [Gordonia sp. (in: high G+C Gram-positive bacteria)]
MWVAHIPVITAHTHTDPQRFGGLLLLLGGSAFVGMQVTGHLLDRYGARRTTVIAVCALCPAMLGPVLAGNTGVLAAALIVFGFVNGGIDVSMNAQAVTVERNYARPIMSTFHGFFSLGGVIGSGAVAAALWAGIGAVTTVSACIAGALVVGVAAARHLPTDREEHSGEAAAGVNQAGRTGSEVNGIEASGGTAADDVAGGSTRRWWHGVDLGRLVLMAVVAFALMLAEGTAYDWSALHVVETFGVRDAIGAIAFGAFSAAMMTARFCVDPIAAAFGPVAVVRFGSLLGIVGMTTAILAPAAPIAIIGWAVCGIGLAGLIPQIFTAAGNLTTHSRGRAISTVVGCGYLGVLSGPALIGFIAGHTSLRVGLVSALAALGLALAAASVVRSASDDPDR